MTRPQKRKKGRKPHMQPVPPGLATHSAFHLLEFPVDGLLRPVVSDGLLGWLRVIQVIASLSPSFPSFSASVKSCRSSKLLLNPQGYEGRPALSRLSSLVP
ncbi:hypothetical protein H1C71_004062 [Ictidomys tridecemlineatus]|nr:hypothetical protein H1C71_004062 [Ictidomys tridecemlineatus]